YNQIQTYKAELPTLFDYNALVVISDGTEARIGTLTAGREWFKPWRTIAGETGDRRVGVVWHTQGSGKSLTMAFYAGRVIREPAMANPTIVVLTDRNDLDDQLFGTFSRCQDLLRQPPGQAQSRADLRAKLAVQA